MKQPQPCAQGWESADPGAGSFTPNPCVRCGWSQEDHRNYERDLKNDILTAINDVLQAEPENLSIARGTIDGKDFYKVERPIGVVEMGAPPQVLPGAVLQVLTDQGVNVMGTLGALLVVEYAYGWWLISDNGGEWNVQRVNSTALTVSVPHTGNHLTRDAVDVAAEIFAVIKSGNAPAPSQGWQAIAQENAMDNELGYVIERYIGSELHYWTGEAPPRVPWTVSHSLALRFARATDANCMLSWHCEDNGRVVHLPLPPSRRQEPSR